MNIRFIAVAAFALVVSGGIYVAAAANSSACSSAGSISIDRSATPATVRFRDEAGSCDLTDDDCGRRFSAYIRAHRPGYFIIPKFGC